MNWIYNTPKEWNTETILFQLTMPGIDEEIAFRGIMLGLLTKILKPSSRTIFHPAILVTALLFGMAHGLFFNNSYELTFKSFPFFNTLILGIVWAWITMKSGSILLALISHNLGNVTNKLISM
ncbi:CPBP family intramembrane glutamic endopeptidase, partial [Tenacibaculum geojense]